MEFHREPGAWNYEFNTQRGMVGVWLRGQGRRVETLAKILAPVHTGALKASIHRDPVVMIPIGMYIEVTADAKRPGYRTSYAKDVHDGTPPHIIKPKDNEVLVFPSKGHVVYTDEVHHPGTRANPFLNRALILVSQGWNTPFPPVGRP